MNLLFEDSARVVLVGVGATAVMDIWLAVLKRFNVVTLNFAFMGRWAGHWRRGTWAHKAIAQAAPIKGELALGWMVHYGVGVAFAALAVVLLGTAWAASPTLAPAIVFGAATIAAPWFVMQPAMGAGVASSRTPTPNRNRLRNLANHLVFGCGLYLAATAVAALWP